MSEPEAPQPSAPQPEAPDRADKAMRRARLGIAAEVVLLAVCAYVIATDTSKAISGDVDTNARIGPFLLNLTAAFVLLRRAISTVQRLLPGPGAWRVAGVGKWVLLISGPVVIAGYLEKLTYQAHRVKVDALAADIATRTGRAVGTQRAVTPADLIDLSGPYLRTVTVRTDTGDFLLEVLLPGLDVDGYTGRYSSTERRWQVHHNDEEAAPAPPFPRDGPLLVCRRDASRMHCEAS